MKKISISIIFFSLLLVTACSSETQSPTDGFYVLSDNTASALIGIDSTVQVVPEEDSSLMILCEEVDRVPVLKEDSTLALVSSTQTGKIFTVYPLEDMGTTLGIICERTASPATYAISTDPGSIVTNSDAAAVLLDPNQIRLTAIGGERIANDLLTQYGTFSNLKRGASYTLTLLSGSTVSREQVVADTSIFSIHGGEAQTAQAVAYADDGYIAVELPPLDTGYYLIIGEDVRNGVFKVARG